MSDFEPKPGTVVTHPNREPVKAPAGVLVDDQTGPVTRNKVVPFPTQDRPLTARDRRRAAKRVKRVIGAGLTFTGGVVLNEATDGGVTHVVKEIGGGAVDVAKEIAGVDREGEVLATTDKPFKLVSYQLSEDEFDYEFQRARKGPSDQDALLEVADLMQQGFDFDNITGVQLVLGDEFGGPTNDFQRRRAEKTLETLKKAFGAPGIPPTYWNFERGLYEQTYGIWLKGIVTNPKTGEAREIYFSPNYGQPVEDLSQTPPVRDL